MTVVGYLRERPAPVLPGVTRDRGTAVAVADVARRALRVPWCWPVLLTLALGFYQVGRPELWRDELSSWSFGTRPLSSLIATARHTGATQLAYYLLLHAWITAFGDSVVAMRSLSVLAMARRGGVRGRGRPPAGWCPGRAVLRAGVRTGAERVPVRAGGPVLLPRGAGRHAGHAVAAARPGPPVGAAVAGLRDVPGAARLHRPGRAVGRRGPRRGGRAALAAGPGQPPALVRGGRGRGPGRLPAAGRARLCSGRRPGQMDTEAGTRPGRLLRSSAATCSTRPRWRRRSSCWPCWPGRSPGSRPRS